MQTAVVTATDTNEFVVIRGGVTTSMLHQLAMTWILPEKDLDSVQLAVLKALGPRSRARRYTIDWSSGPGSVIYFSPFKRPDVLTYRGVPSSFVLRHRLAAAMRVSVTSSPLLHVRDFQKTVPVPAEFV